MDREEIKKQNKSDEILTTDVFFKYKKESHKTL